ncbi:MAG: hypothetical protein ACO1RT_17625 [Planctomycetaceae bacterium]
MRVYFQGEMSTIAVVIIAIAVAVAVAWYYSRETKALPLPHRWLLPLLRGFAIVLVIFMLAGPMVELRRQRGNIATVNVFIDASDSMKFRDAPASDAGGIQPPAPASDGQQPAEPLPTGEAHSRIDRAAALLLGDQGTPGWLESVKLTHRVKLFLLGGDSAQQIYDSASPEPPPTSISLNDQSLDPSRTNLSDALSDRLLGAGVETATAGDPKQEKVGTGQAIVVLSDGQHNSGTSPEENSKRLGDMSIPVFTIGLGRQSEPVDLAVLDIDAPALVAANGRAAGTLSIKDLGNPGDRYLVRILSGDRTAWQTTLTTENQANRRVAFDFPVADLAARHSEDDSASLDRSKVTIPLQVVLESVPGEYDLSNNSIDYRLSASTRTRRMLIVDSRSRWETRYIHNVFDRDPTWSVETIILWPDRSKLVDLDERPPEFPKDQKTLASFDVIVWGDVDPQVVSTEQLGLVRDFVSQGGGLVFVDGDRDHLASMKDTALGDLVPVRFVSNQRIGASMKLAVTPLGAERAAMSLLPGGDSSKEDNEAAWAGLQPPTSIRQVQTLPGAEVWLEAKVDSLDAVAPVLVTRLFGGGQVVYLATDQTWRWRYRVADLYHARFWNQLVEAIMQPPFDVRDQYVALSTGAAQYRAGEHATIRAQLRDSAGNPETEAVVDAVLKRDGVSEQVVPLRLVDPSRGIYQGESDPLTTGEYTTTVRAAGYSASASVKSSFLVSPPPNRENFRLAQNSELLSAMANASHGVYADASNAQRVWDAIKPLSDGKIEIRKLALAQSFVWFVAVLLLLSLEWWLRKKVGLV